MTLTPDEKRAFSTAEAAVYLGVSTAVLKQARIYGERKKRLGGPPFRRLGGRKIVYLREDLDAWLEGHAATATTTAETTAEAAA